MRNVLAGLVVAALALSSSGCALFWMLIEGGQGEVAGGEPAGPCADTCNHALRDGGWPCGDGESEYEDLIACACAVDPTQASDVSTCENACAETLCKGRATPYYQDPAHGFLSSCESCLRRLCPDVALTCEGHPTS
jgi:hypothetical protein